MLFIVFFSFYKKNKKFKKNNNRFNSFLIQKNIYIIDYNFFLAGIFYYSYFFINYWSNHKFILLIYNYLLLLRNYIT